VKQLHGTSSALVDASLDETYRLLHDVEHYPDWYPDMVRSVEVVERDRYGHATKARTHLNVTAGALGSRQFNLLMTVEGEPLELVRLARIPHHAGDEEAFAVSWHLTQEAKTRIRVTLDANLSIPRFLPVGGLGDTLAQGFVTAATKALRG
jgi:ribosome-associated toxin RatA of RatAB toxin-antitoxin module